jgi:hypothetical protein
VAAAVKAPAVPVPAPELSAQETLDLLQGALSKLVGAQGAWTLVPRSSDDTDTIFHDLKAGEIARDLAGLLERERAALRGETLAADIQEPLALPWDPAPISVWADPRRATVTDPVELPVHGAETRLVA